MQGAKDTKDSEAVMRKSLLSCISGPVCARCAKSAGYTPADCERFDCLPLFKQEVDNIINLLGGEHVLALADALKRAREKRPVFAQSPAYGWLAIEQELVELDTAICSESEERQRAEAMDVAVTAIRFWLGEYKKSGD